MPKIIVIGEALVEVMRPDKSTPLDQPGNFEGPFASGAPAIFAVAAARLGLPVGFIGSVGDDSFGDLLQQRLEAEQVDRSYVQVVPGYTTGIAFIAYTADGSREFVFHLRHSAAAQLATERLDAADFADVAWLHISGSTLFLSEACRQACAAALRYTKDAGGKLSLDPNLRPELMPVDQARQVLAPYLETADLLLPYRNRKETEQGHLRQLEKGDGIFDQNKHYAHGHRDRNDSGNEQRSLDNCLANSRFLLQTFFNLSCCLTLI